MIGEKTIIPADVIPESDIAPIMRRANELEEENEKLKEKNEYLQKEVEDAKAVGERALCEVQELTEKNKRLVEEHTRQNGTIQALNIALDPTVIKGVQLIVDKSANIEKTGLDTADTATLHVLYHMASDEKVVAGKKYLEPKKWAKQINDTLGHTVTFASGDFFIEGEHDEKMIAGLTTGVEPIVITGIQTTENEKTYTYGSEGYILSIENSLIKDKSLLVNTVGAKLTGVSFMNFSGEHLSYPLADFMDLAYVIDRNGKVNKTILTDITFNFLGFTSLKCSAENAIRNSSKYVTSETKAVQKASAMADKKISKYDEAVQSLTALMTQGMGFFKTEKIQDDNQIIAGKVGIDDTQLSGSTVYSSEKTDQLYVKKTEYDKLVEKVNSLVSDLSNALVSR